MTKTERTHGDSIIKLTAWHVMSHGRFGAVSGTIRYRDAERGLCHHLFEFASAKGICVSVITSYQIDIQDRPARGGCRGRRDRAAAEPEGCAAQGAVSWWHHASPE
ncbi:MAG: hypothetical protein JXQ75_01700 [Phycisphaerae bacterium]|nr:hypothetical protein [Phycisphaerae bacterium]